MTKQSVPVSERALVQRVNRKLRHDDRRLCAARGFWAEGTHYDSTDLGRYYVVDVMRNAVVDRQVDLETYGRDLGVLASWESLSEAESTAKGE